MRTTMVFLAALAIALPCLAAQFRDDINLPFINDPGVIGKWTSVDFVTSIGDFVPGQRQWIGGELSLTELTFKKNGRTSNVYQGRTSSFLLWTKGVLIHPGEQTASHYEIRDIDGTQYMFLEHKSGDYIFRGMKPRYYVLKRKK